MKKIWIFIIFLILIIFSFVSWSIYDGIKMEQSENERKFFIQERKKYMSKIDNISLYGIYLRDNVNKYLGNFLLDENGLYLMPNFEGYDISTSFIDKKFTTEISATIENENFIEFFVSYDPYSRVIYKIIGVLPIKFIDLMDEEDKKTMSNSQAASKYFKKCKKTLEPIISIIDDGIKSKTDLLSVEDKFRSIDKGISINYKMNSGIEYIINKKVGSVMFLDKNPESYYGIKSKSILSSVYKDYKATVINLAGHCNAYRKNKSLYISLTHKVIEYYVHSEVSPAFEKHLYNKKISKEEKELMEKKKSIDNSGLK